MADTTLVFEISGSRFGIDAGLVTAVCALGALTPLPMCPECVPGVCFLRGKVYPAVDIAKLAGLNHQGGYGCAILVRSGDTDMAILADGVVKTVKREAQDGSRGAKDRLFGSFLPDKTAVIDIDCLISIILRSSEGVI